MSVRNYGLITSIEELAAFCDRLLGGGPIGFDIETGYHGEDQEKGSLRAETNLLAGISFTNSTDWARYAPLGHDTGVNLDNREAARLLWPVLSSGRAVAHNASFEMRRMSRWFREQLSDDLVFGAQVRASNGYFPVLSDTLVEAYLVAEFKAFGLKFLTKAMFDHTMTELHELFPGLTKNRRKFLRFNTLELTPQVVEYACEDSVWCLAIHERYYPLVKDRLLYRAELAVLSSVTEMEDVGVQYDWGFMQRGSEALRDFQSAFNAEIMAELTEMTGEQTAINLGSWQQVGKLLYGQLGLKTSVYTKSTKDLPRNQRTMSTSSIALAGLAKQYPVVKKIAQWKEMSKLAGTYLDKYERLYSGAPDGRAHPNHLSAFVVTGRFAVSDPPYQQSPKKYHFDLKPAKDAHAAHAQAHGPKCTCPDPDYQPPPGSCFTLNFRNAIVAPPEHYMLGFDLSQAELRAIAGEAQETALLRAFENGDDVHALTASLMLGVPLAEITEDQRSVGKTMNFALLYGMGVKSLADRLGYTRQEAQRLFDMFFAAYSGIDAWSRSQVAFGKAYGYVTSKFGRRLPIWEFESDKRWIYEKGERACVNYPIQGAATGDYMKIAMVRVRKALREAGLADRVHLVMNVHDALEFYVHQSLDNPQEIINILQAAVIFPVPGWPAMKADWHIAKKWGSPMKVELTDDGRMLVKGAKTYELLPTLEENEESGELEVVLPDDDVDAVRRALAVLPAQRTGARHVTIELADMPTADGYGRFLALLDEHPGEDTVTLRTPDGSELAVDGTTGIGPKHQAQVCYVLGDCRVRYDAADVDAHELLEGLTI